MQTELRILMLEDSPTDAELIERELRKAGMSFTLKRVETRAAFAGALEDFLPDIILSDYHLPDFSGKDALEIARRDHPEIPVIFVTGALPDKDAASLIDAGAKDYVLKDRLARLAPAVQRALSVEHGVKIRKLTEAQLQEKTELLENVINSSLDFIFVKDRELRTILCNEVFAGALGKKPEELYGKTDIENGWDAELVKGNPGKGIRGFEQDDLATLAGNVVHSTSDLGNVLGEIRYFDSVKVPLKSSNGKIFGMLGISRDVTERKRAEEAIKLYAHDMNERVKEMSCLNDIITMSLIGELSVEQLLDKCVRRMPDAWLEPSRTCARIRLGSQAFETPNFQETEWKLAAEIPLVANESGSVEVFYKGEGDEVINNPFLDEEHALINSIAMQLGLSLERRRVNEALQQNQTELQEAQRIAHVGNWRLDLATNHVAWSEELYRMQGVDPNIAPPDYNEHHRLFTPESWERLSTTLSHTQKTGAPYELELEMVRPDGSHGWMLSRGEALRDASGSIVAIRGAAADITVRKQNEIKIRRSTHLYAALSQCNEHIMRCDNEQALLSQVCSDTVIFGEMKMAWIGLTDPDTKKVMPVASFGNGTDYLRDIEIVTDAESPYGRGPTGTSIRENRPFWCDDFQHDPATEPWRERGARFGWKASAALPLHRNGSVVGSLTLYADTADIFDEAARNLLLEIATNISFALDKLAHEAKRKQMEESLHNLNRDFVSFLENTTDFIYYKDENSRFRFCSQTLANITGHTNWRDMIGKHDMEVFPEDTAKIYYEEELPIFRDGKPLLGKIDPYYDTQHGKGWVSTNKWPVFDSHGKQVVGIFGISRDITEQVKSQERFRLTAKVFENTMEGITITDKDNNILEVNDAFTRITGYPREEVLGKPPSVLKSGLHDKDFYAAMWQAVNTTGHWRGDIWNRRKDGEVYPEMLTVSTITDDEGNVTNYVGIFSDITLIKQHEKQLEHIAHYDALTGIPNRVLLADRLQQAIAFSKREKKLLAVCYLDLDGFKAINDSMGHEAGDQVLIDISRRIKDTVREGDTVARLGGDEFVVLLTGLDAPEECAASLNRLLEAVAQPISVLEKFFKLSASIGVSLYPHDNEDPDILLRHADQAMYTAKQSGKNRYYLYDTERDQSTRTRHELTRRIKQGLERGEFEFFFQPKVDLRSGQPVGAEALIRWRHPERGLLFPAEFLHAIEDTMLDIEVGEWVIATALDQLMKWRQAELDIELSINISAFHMQSPEFTEKLKQKLSHYPGLPPGRLQIEILETAALKDIAAATRIIESCRDFGVGFALDDFGTGYSSLSYLSNLPIDTLKIDQSFVRDMLEDSGDFAIVQGIIALSSAFKLKTVAEGVATDRCFRALLDMGCEIGQGYAIARPMPAEDFSVWYKKKCNSAT